MQNKKFSAEWKGKPDKERQRVKHIKYSAVWQKNRLLVSQWEHEIFSFVMVFCHFILKCIFTWKKHYRVMYKYMKNKVPTTSKTGTQPSKAVSQITQEQEQQLLLFRVDPAWLGSCIQKCESMPLENTQNGIITFPLLLSAILREGIWKPVISFTCLQRQASTQGIICYSL